MSNRVIYQPHRVHKRHQQRSPGWIVTYADMMALLLTFFIILSSISTADEDKYKAVSESMEKAFGLSGDKKQQDQIVTQGDSDSSKKGDFIKPPSKDPQPENKSGAEDPSQEKLNVIRMETVTKLLAKEIQQGTVQVEIKNSSVVMRFPERVAFPSGSDELHSTFDPAIENLVKVLKKLKGEVTISGHTDNRPIDTFRFRSNWELSSARAISVLHALLKKSGLKAERFTVQGHADTHPLKDNNSATNRAENRRVEISIQVPTDNSKQDIKTEKKKTPTDSDKPAKLINRQPNKTTNQPTISTPQKSAPPKEAVKNTVFKVPS